MWPSAALRSADSHRLGFTPGRHPAFRPLANGVQRVNLDLVYGLPFQTVDSCRETVEECLTLRPDRLAVFGYAHGPAFKPHQRKIDGASLPDSESRFAQSRAIHEALSAAVYVQIGLDHFALPDDPLAIAARSGRLHRNFQGYTTDDAAALIGFGASSIGHLPNGYVQNTPNIPFTRSVSRPGSYRSSAATV